MTRAVDDPETIDVRADEKLDLTRLEPWLREHLEGARGPLTVRQFGGGHANLTYLLTFDSTEFVLRRPPLGPVAQSAHDMKREHRVLKDLWRAYPLAPRSFVLCTDPDILGVDFHVLERREGFVIRANNTAVIDDNPDLCRRIGAMIVASLADLHRVEPATVGLGDLGRPEGFVARQVAGWTQRWHAALDDDAPDAGDLIAWIETDIPASSQVSLVHNDFKLDNIMVAHDDPARAVAVLDWDMCTRGDPLLDLANLLNYWAEATDSDLQRRAAWMPTDRPGFPTRTQIAESYAEHTGFDISRLTWYEVFGAFKVAVIIQQIYIRYLRGQTRDARFAAMGERVRALIEKAKGLTV
jgi:aminoglycoside phosphotransferase (APT) family kinase protein